MENSINENVNFSCNMCGKCCSESPRTHFYEMLELSNEFVFQTTHNAILSTTKKLLDKKIAEHYGVLGHTIVMPELEASMFYFIDFKPLELPTYKGCSKLTPEGKCSIYASRPTLCRLAPLSPYFSESQQYRVIQIFEDNTKKNIWNCDFESKTAILKKGEIAKYQDDEMYIAYINSTRAMTDLFVEAVSFSEETKNNHFKTLFQMINKNSTMITDLVHVLKIAALNNILSKTYITKVIENQLKLLYKEIEISKNNKLKENLHVTKVYKEFIQNYEKALKNNIFYTDTENFTLI